MLVLGGYRNLGMVNMMVKMMMKTEGDELMREMITMLITERMNFAVKETTTALLSVKKTMNIYAESGSAVFLRLETLK